jgi:phosphohistidine phosphatase
MERARLDTELRYDERIYEASVALLLAVLMQTEDGINELMLVGHNPGMEDLLFALTGESRRMRTAALAKITLDLDKWNKLQERSGHLEWLVEPKELA